MTVDLTEAQRLAEALNRDYAHCIDDDRLEEWPSMFTADGRYVITFMFTTFLLRPDMPPDYVGPPFDATRLPSNQ